MGHVMYMRKGDVHTAPSNFPRIGTPLNDMTWEQIRAISDAGLASNYFSVGDSKNIIINGKVGDTTFSNLSVDVFIIGIDHNASVEGSNKIHFQIGKINGKDVCLCDSNYGKQVTTSITFRMNSLNASSGNAGWAGCHMRNNILGAGNDPTNPASNTLLAAIPSDLRAVMKSVNKYSDNVYNGTDTASNVTASIDYLWLLSEFELFGSRKYANSAEKNYQKQYDFYKAGNSKVKYKHNATSSACNRWLRSPYMTSYGCIFCTVDTSGSPMTTTENMSYGVSPVFAV